MTVDLERIIFECQEYRILGYREYIAVDQDAGTLFLTTKSEGDGTGRSVRAIVERILNFSEPLRRAMDNTTAVSGTKTWRERGMDISWHYHPDIGLNLSVLIEPR